MSNSTAVVIIGAGVSGLTLATFLTLSHVPCILLERRNRAHIQTRQRAGAVEARAVDMFERWKLADKLLGGSTLAQAIDYRVDGVSRLFDIVDDADSPPGRFCTQQMLVANLMQELIDVMAADVRFDATDIIIHNELGSRPTVGYMAGGSSNSDSRVELVCDYVVGCDGDQGISRSSIPPGVLTKYSHEFGYAWLAALIELPGKGHAVMAVSKRGFAAQIPRGPQRSRFYLQSALSDRHQDWPDERIFSELRLRLNEPSLPATAVVHDKLFVPLRAVVHAPMQHNNLFLAGDAAHLVPPTGAKGMNMALYDVDILATALIAAVRDGDKGGLDGYSGAVLPHVWRYQEFSVWMTDTMHDGGDVTLHSEYRRQVARARLDALFESKTAGRLHSEYLRGKV